MTLPSEVVLFLAAAVAGAMNAFAGGGSLVAFPALVWAGLPPTIANATNTVAIFPGSLVTMIPFRREIASATTWLRRLLPWSIVGGVAGSILLLSTPERVFARLVPGLILFATATFALQEAFGRGGAAAIRADGAPGPAGAGDGPVDPGERPGGVVAALLQLAISVYGGYFGAGIGILMLAALGHLGLRDLRRRMAVRTCLATCINGVAAVCFVLGGAVDWRSAGIMAAGQVLGGFGGGSVARAVPRAWARRAVILIGTGMAVAMALRDR